jgi:hypothetical protein
MSKQVDSSIYSLPLFNEEARQQVDLVDAIAAKPVEIFHAPYIAREAIKAPNGYGWEILERKNGEYVHHCYAWTKASAADRIERLVIRDAKAEVALALAVKIDLEASKAAQ